MDKKIFKRIEYDPSSEMAYRWAPILYQHVDLGYPRRDMLCAVDYDGDWNTANNRENIYKFDLIPIVYYATSETSTHQYILYAFYHADDLDHENDLEGCLLVVDKKRDRLLCMITIAHWNFYSYVISGRLNPGKESIDGKLYYENFDGNAHPMTRQEPLKHGFYAWRGAPRWMLWEKKDSKKSTGVRYVPSNEAYMPDENKIGSFADTNYGYVLVDIRGEKGFWQKRNEPSIFSSWGTLNSSTPKSAHAPWVWDDFNDDLETGTIFYDPAKIVFKYFSGFDEFDSNYVKPVVAKP